MAPKHGWRGAVPKLQLGIALMLTVAMVLLVAPAAFARVDQFGGAAVAEPYAPYTAGPTAGTAEAYAPYTAGPVVRESEPYAPYTAGPVVGSTRVPENIGHYMVK